MVDSSSSQPDPSQNRERNWASPVDRLNVNDVPQDAVNLNVDGRHVTTPMQGFGQMWQKTYRIRFDGVQVQPRDVVRVWREKFSDFWPKNNRFYGSSGGPLRAGDVAVLNLSGPNGMTAPGGAPVISTGILVIYADDDQFTFMTPEGHMFAGMNTFSAYEDDGVTVAQIQALVRASDPLYELSLRLKFGHKMEDDFWFVTLQNLAAHFKAKGTPVLTKVCIDSGLQWSQAKNVWHNAAVRTTVYLIGAPLRWVGRKIGGRK